MKRAAEKKDGPPSEQESATGAAPQGQTVEGEARAPTAIVPYKSKIVEYNKTAEELAKLQAEYGGVVYPVATAKGMAAAKAARWLFVKLRTGLDAAHKEVKAEVLQRSKDIDGERRAILGMIEPLEKGIADQIDAEENRIQSEKLAKEKAEAYRIAAEERARKDAEEAKLKAAQEEIARQQAELAEAKRKQDAEAQAQRDAIAKEQAEARAKIEQEQTEARRKARETEEAAIDKLKAEREEQEAKLRAERAESEAKAEAERQRLRAEDERIAAARKAIEDEQRKAADESAARARADAEAKHQAELKAQAEQQAKELAEQRAKEEAERIERQRIAAEKEKAAQQERETQRAAQELLDADQMLATFKERFGKLPRYATIIKAIDKLARGD